MLARVVTLRFDPAMRRFRAWKAYSGRIWDTALRLDPWVVQIIFRLFKGELS